jgi:hypothetical protein
VPTTRNIAASFPKLLHFAMDRCPDEILINIFALACTDDGTTGRMLSIVNRRARSVSHTVRHRSLALFGAAQLRAIVALLEAEHSARGVQHLLVSPRPRAQRTLGAGSSAGASQRTTCDADRGKDNVSREREDESTSLAALGMLLQLVAPTLRTLFVDGSVLIPVAHPLPLPSLSALSASVLFGHAGDVHPTSILTPALLRLHIASCPPLSGDSRGAWLSIATLAGADPDACLALTHLRVTGCHIQGLPGYLRVQLGIPTIPNSSIMFCTFAPGSAQHAEASSLAARLPRLKSVWVHARHVYREGYPLSACLAAADISALGILKWQMRQDPEEKGSTRRLLGFPISDGEYGLAELLDDWLDYVGGGEGPWPCNTGKP